MTAAPAEPDGVPTPMTRPRRALAVSLAAATLAVLLAVIAMGGLPVLGLGVAKRGGDRTGWS